MATMWVVDSTRSRSEDMADFRSRR